MAGGSERFSVCPVLIGRDDAVGALRHALDAAAGGAAQAAPVLFLKNVLQFFVPEATPGALLESAPTNSGR